MKTETSCGAIITRKNPAGKTEVLLVRQKNGFVSFPKGHIEAGETELDAARREVREETGLEVTISAKPRFELEYNIAPGAMSQDPFIPTEPIHKIVVLFLATAKQGNEAPQPSEIDSLLWVPIIEVENHLAYPAWRRAWAAAKAELERRP